MFTGRRLSRVSLAVVALALLAFAPGARAAAAPLRVPAAGHIVWSHVAVRAQPDRTARRITVLDAFEPDFRLRTILAMDVRLSDDGTAAWYRISLPGRPNGRTGWVPAEAVDVRSTRAEVIVRRGARTLELRRDGRFVLRTRVAVGKPGAETPLGLFYVTEKFRPTDTFLGAYAFATSAYSRLTDWPGGGIVGLHGTNTPGSVLGRAVSHGCVRIENSVVLRLAKLVPVGTPIRILP